MGNRCLYLDSTQMDHGAVGRLSALMPSHCLPRVTQVKTGPGETLDGGSSRGGGEQRWCVHACIPLREPLAGGVLSRSSSDFMAERRGLRPLAAALLAMAGESAGSHGELWSGRWSSPGEGIQIKSASASAVDVVDVVGYDIWGNELRCRREKCSWQ
jgi:hypothetical protein